jgi:hypothetical protein
MGNLILKAFLSYIESHPDVIEKLVHLLITELIDTLSKKQSASA